MSEDERGQRAADLWYGNAAPTDDDLQELARTESWREERVGASCALGHLRTVLAAAALFDARADKMRAGASRGRTWA